MVATANLRIDQGTTFTTDVTVIGTKAEVLHAETNAIAKLAKGYSSTSTRTSFTTTINSDPTTGIITLLLSADQTNALEAPARYVFDVEILKQSDNTVTRVVEGIITVSPSVTI